MANASSSITWLKGYVPTSAVTEYSGKPIAGNRESDGIGGIVDAPFVTGHKTVQTAAYLQDIPGCVLSIAMSNTLFANRGSIQKDTNGNIPDAIGQEWYVQDEACKYKLVSFDGTNSKWEKIENASYISGTINSYLSDTKTDLSNNWSYTYNAYNTVKEEISSTYTYLLECISNAIDLLRSEFIWKSGLNGNTTSYLWAGTLTDFNKLDTKPTDTTFIVTN